MYPKNDKNTTRISIRISNDLLEEFDNYAKSKGYQSRNKAINEIIQNELKK